MRSRPGALPSGGSSGSLARWLVGSRAQLSCAVTRRDRVAPVPAERPITDPHSRWRLAPLVLVALHHFEHAADGRAIEAARGNLVDREIFLDEELEDGIEHFVRWQ